MSAILTFFAHGQAGDRLGELAAAAARWWGDVAFGGAPTREAALAAHRDLATLSVALGFMVFCAVWWALWGLVRCCGHRSCCCKGGDGEGADGGMGPADALRVRRAARLAGYDFDDG